jgi:two-component system chemotaxis response regulator CheB
VVLIGASTGAPRTHDVYLKKIPAGFPAPVVIVQHLPRGPFIQGIMRYLKENVSRPVELARDLTQITAGTIYVVEPGRQMRFVSRDGTVNVTEHAGENRFTPSMNVTFSSAAAVFGPRCAVAMLAGLHAEFDGLEGCRAVRRAGGRVLVTTRATTPCYSMIEQLREAGECDEEAALQDVITVISGWFRSAT